MNVPVIAFFNNKGGVGKTSLVYHLAWMLADTGHRVLAADLDPQANLTSAFLDEEDLEVLWSTDGRRETIWGAIRPFHTGEGGFSEIALTPTAEERLAVLPGDLALSAFEDELSSAWPKCLDRDARSFRVISAFWTIINRAAEKHSADLVLVDVGPSLGAINRAALVSSDHVVIPVAPDLFSFQGLRNLGPALRDWRAGWHNRLRVRPASISESPDGRMNALGYVVLQHGVRLDRPVKAYQRWMDRIPGEFRSSVLASEEPALPVGTDPYCLGQLKHYHGLMSLAQEARKPIFALTSADGAFGGHFQAAKDAYGHFHSLAGRILSRMGSGIA
ncbi:ParA family protein [Saccharothrix australiensis]|uniref:AAA domain-containing protein n=1 Tax=Saccharothrix australiensis TaxID=2072 RepID=A0A495W6C6_9PSEU|nr:ParA family protein [Saccharothrix australiensis]RKT57212.1 AAA domain-containing protein [Saccharothrix australiensis]